MRLYLTLVTIERDYLSTQLDAARFYKAFSCYDSRWSCDATALLAGAVLPWPYNARWPSSRNNALNNFALLGRCFVVLAGQFA